MKRKSHKKGIHIRQALSILLACSVLVVAIIGLISFQVSFSKYNDIVYDLAVEALNLYTANVENELNNIEEHTFTIVTHKLVQEYLKQANTDEGMRPAVYPLLTSLLPSIGIKENYTESVSIVDNQGTIYSQGHVFFSEDFMKHLIEQAAVAQGRLVIVPPQAEDDSILFVRQIRQMEQIGLISYGTLILRINPQKLVDFTSKYAGRYSGNLSIYEENQPVYQAIGANHQDHLIEDIMERKEKQNARDGFFIRELSGGKQFVVYSDSPNTSWTYVNALSYDDLFHKLSRIRNINLLLVLLALLVVIIIGILLASALSRPLVTLTQAMKRVEGDSFEWEYQDMQSPGIFYEMQKLYNDYGLMINRIDTLINENYRKQLLLKETQLRWLEAQINPHFLYNTLESINWMARMDGNQEIAVMAKSLGQLMREAVSRDHTGSISLERELALLEDYLVIQQIRYKDRLEVTIAVEEAARSATVPKIILQPLVENSIHYGLEAITGICRITVLVQLEEDTVVIKVSDNGPGIPEQAMVHFHDSERRSSRTGIGLYNIRERLSILYGGQANLLLENNPDGGLTVTIRVPYIEEGYDV